jgi:hypothetical protein
MVKFITIKSILIDWVKIVIIDVIVEIKSSMLPDDGAATWQYL